PPRWLILPDGKGRPRCFELRQQTARVARCVCNTLFWIGICKAPPGQRTCRRSVQFGTLKVLSRRGLPREERIRNSRRFGKKLRENRIDKVPANDMIPLPRRPNRLVR